MSKSQQNQLHVPVGGAVGRKGPPFRLRDKTTHYTEEEESSVEQKHAVAALPNFPSPDNPGRCISAEAKDDILPASSGKGVGVVIPDDASWIECMQGRTHVDNRSAPLPLPSNAASAFRHVRRDIDSDSDDADVTLAMTLSTSWDTAGDAGDEEFPPHPEPTLPNGPAKPGVVEHSRGVYHGTTPSQRLASKLREGRRQDTSAGGTNNTTSAYSWIERKQGHRGRNKNESRERKSPSTATGIPEAIPPENPTQNDVSWIERKQGRRRRADKKDQIQRESSPPTRYAHPEHQQANVEVEFCSGRQDLNNDSEDADAALAMILQASLGNGEALPSPPGAYRITGLNHQDSLQSSMQQSTKTSTSSIPILVATAVSEKEDGEDEDLPRAFVVATKDTVLQLFWHNRPAQCCVSVTIMLLIGLAIGLAVSLTPSTDPTHAPTAQEGSWISSARVEEPGSSYFGKHISLSSEGARIAVSAGANDSIRVYEEAQDGTWAKLPGSDVVGDTMAFSGDGNKLAVQSEDYLKVYEYISGSWQQVGDSIPEMLLAYSISLSEDGTIIAASTQATVNRIVYVEARVFSYSESGWAQVGESMHREDYLYDQYSVSLSAKGDTLAFVDRVYQLDASSKSWILIHEGVMTETGIGFSILSSDGSTRAILLPAPDFSGDIVGIQDPTAVHVSKYGVKDEGWGEGWTARPEISINATTEVFYATLSLSADGNVLALGVGPNDGKALEDLDKETDLGNDHHEVLDEEGPVRLREVKTEGIPSCARVFHFDASNNQWQWKLFGEDICGETESHLFGKSVSLSSNGRRIAVGSPGRDLDGSGCFEIFDLDP